jgi:class 3 adenylate cyclase
VRRLKPLDRVLLCTLVPLWVVAFGLHVREVAHGRLAWVSVFVARGGADAPPVVRGFWPGSGGERSGLAAGDAIVAIGGVAAAGVGPVGFVARALAAAHDGVVDVRYRRDGETRDAAVPIIRAVVPWRIAPLVVMMAITGALVLLRVPDRPIGRTFFLASITYALHWTFFPGGSVAQTGAWAVVFGLASSVTFPLWLRAAHLFPKEAMPRDGRLPWWPWAFALFGPAALTWVFGMPLPPAVGQPLAFAINVAFIATTLALVTRSYRRVDALGRRQLRWVVFGFWVGLGPVLAVNVVAAAMPELWWLHEVVAITLVVPPLAFLLAIVRANLFDIDRLIATTAIYSVLSFLGLAIVLTLVPQASRPVAHAVGIDVGTAQTVLAIVVAACIAPGRRFLRPRLERLFFAETVALREDVDGLLRRLGGLGDEDALALLVASELAAMLRTTRCLLYRLRGDEYEPLEIGSAPPRAQPPPPLGPAFLGAATAGTGPIDLQDDAAGVAHAALPAAARILLGALGVSVLLPIRRGTQLRAFVGLGAKRSGDVYTASDLALLAAVASQCATELVRMELGRFAPSEVVETLASDPGALVPVEREVSLLFCDLEGSARIAEALPPDTVRGFQADYLQTMSDRVARERGLLVKTIGDAVMGLWNAPVPLPDHAERACRSALAMLAATRELGATWTGHGVRSVAVRIGVHTGVASVGNFGTSARVEYDARGDSVNLASRLEGLNKAYGTRLLVSDATRGALGDLFVSREIDRVRVVGRAQPVVVHEILCARDDAGAGDAAALVAAWEDGLAAYRRRDFDAALARLGRIDDAHPGDGPTLALAARCRALRDVPPPADWDGVTDAHAK